MAFKIVDYMLDCATRLKSIGHTQYDPRFFRCSSIANLEELLHTGMAGSPCVVVTDSPEGRLEDADSDNVQDRQYYSFAVFAHVDAGDFSKREGAIQLTKAVAFKILGKMKRDKKGENSCSFGIFRVGLRNLEIGSVSYTTVGPFGDNFWGTDVSFTILNKPDLLYNAEDWLPYE